MKALLKFLTKLEGEGHPLAPELSAMFKAKLAKNKGAIGKASEALYSKDRTFFNSPEFEDAHKLYLEGK